MSLECTVTAVIGFPIRKNQIMETVESPSCEHVKPAGAAFCPDCGVRIGMRMVEVVKVLQREMPFRKLEWLTICDCELLSREAFDGHDPSDDERYLLGIHMGEAVVVPDSTPADIQIENIHSALNKVMAAWALFPGSPPPSLHLLPNASS